MRDKNDKKRVKKLLAAVAVITAAAAVLCLVLFLVSSLLKSKTDTQRYNSERVYANEDYGADIFEDELYLSRERRIMYTENGDTEPLTQEEATEKGSFTEFLYNYFTIVVNGQYDEYKNLFTDEFLKKYSIPERFTMQKLYDINVQYLSPGEQEGSGLFKLSYKIMQNNGSFRGDIIENGSSPVIVELVTTDGRVLINSMGFSAN